MKLAIVGTRNPSISYQDWADSINLTGVTTIISGGAKGIDSYAKRLAQENNIPIIEFLPEYNKYGKAAPMVRNQSIIDACDSVEAFPSKDSRGTTDSINKARKANKPITIHVI